jgi:hypothetical protein
LERLDEIFGFPPHSAVTDFGRRRRGTAGLSIVPLHINHDDRKDPERGNLLALYALR